MLIFMYAALVGRLPKYICMFSTTDFADSEQNIAYALPNICGHKLGSGRRQDA